MPVENVPKQRFIPKCDSLTDLSVLVDVEILIVFGEPTGSWICPRSISEVERTRISPAAVQQVNILIGIKTTPGADHPRPYFVRPLLAIEQEPRKIIIHKNVQGPPGLIALNRGHTPATDRFPQRPRNIAEPLSGSERQLIAVS